MSQNAGDTMTEISALAESDVAPGGTIVVAPHGFIDLDREQHLADEFGLELYAATTVETFRAALPDADLVLVTPYARVEAADIASMKRCRAIVRYGIGYDNIDVDAAANAGIPVSIVPGASSEEVASHSLAMGLALVRRLPAGHASIGEGAWAGAIAYDTPRFSELEVGVVGIGRIGRQVARWYSSLGSTVRVHDPYLEQDQEFRTAPLDDLLVGSDVVSLHLPLTAQTRHLISADVLQRMRRRTVIVNVSRGGLIDEAALADALRSGHVAGAGLDTFDQEPLPQTHPLRGAPNLIATPHIAWRSDRALESLQSGAVLRCRQVLTAQPVDDLVNGI